MRIGVPTETAPDDRRVALVPEDIPSLTEAGCTVVVEAGAGIGAGFPDAAYASAGAEVLANAPALVDAADVIVVVHATATVGTHARFAIERLRPGQILAGLLDPFGNPELLQALAGEGVTTFALDLMPRITRAQSMDVLTSLASIAGYKAALLAASHLTRFMPLMITPAGSVAPARALVLGAGVAGLQAIATAKRLGALVSAYDVRAAAREEIASLGATPLDLDLDTAGTEGAGGYAQAMDDAFYARQQAALAQAIAEQDVVITTAAVPGRRAPVLVTRAAVEAMRPGSVVVDLAAASGGNCECTEPDAIVDVGGVTVLGPRDLAATLPHDASRMYSRNLVTFLRHCIQDGRLALDRTDPVVAETLCTRDGAIVHPDVRRRLGLNGPDGEGAA